MHLIVEIYHQIVPTPPCRIRGRGCLCLRHFAARFGAALARLGAPLAMISLVLAAFGSTALARLGA